jgi:ubiquinone biosynthesis protein UbiJ
MPDIRAYSVTRLPNLDNFYMLRFPATALNHLLSQSGWALPRLAVHAGKTARFNIAPFSFSCTIQQDGTLHSSSINATPDAVCTISASLLPRLVSHDESAFSQIVCAGDAALLTEIFYLGRHLRWDAAEDISRATGDIAAERIVRFAQSGYRHMHDASLHLAQALTEYWTEEKPLLAKAAHVVTFAQQLTHLVEDVQRLEQRIKLLSERNT